MRAVKMLLLSLGRWCFWYPVRILVQALPLGRVYALADLIARLSALFMGRKRRITEQGMDIFFQGRLSPAQLQSISLATINNVVKKSLESMWYPKFTADLCQRQISVNGIEHLDAALKEERGVVLLHGHIGNPHMVMPALGHLGYPMNQLGSRNPPQPLHGPFSGLINTINHALFKLKLGYKEALPVNFVYTDLPVRNVFRRLSGNEVLAVAMDGREGTQWFPTTYMGQKAFFATGTMKMLLATKPVVLPTIMLRNKDDSHRVIIYPPMEIKETGNRQQDIQTNTEAFLKIMEKHIAEEPAQYGDVFWLGEGFFPEMKGP